MALVKLIESGYGQVELNQVAFRRDGRIEAQCALDGSTVGFGTTAHPYAENGMILVVDNIQRKIKLPNGVDSTITADNDAAGTIYGLNYSTEHMYDERANGLKDFKLGVGDFYPRIGYLSIGDKFTTNSVIYDTDTYADLAAVKTAVAALATTPIYGVPCSDGYIKLVTEIPEAATLVLKVIKGTTMPDGQYALKFQVVKE